MTARAGDSDLDNLYRIHSDFLLENEIVETLARALREPGSLPLALVLFDVDRSADLRARSIDYKLRLLAELHAFVGSQAYPDAWLAHVGSRDDLTLILRGASCHSRAAALAEADRLREAIGGREFGRLLGQPCRLTVSGGVSVAPTDSRDPFELYLLAESATRASKEAGRNCCTLGTPGFDQQIRLELSRARRDELELLSRTTGRPVPELLREAIRLVLQRHSGLERFCGGAVFGVLP